MTLTPNEWPGALKRLIEVWAEHERARKTASVFDRVGSCNVC